LRPIPVVFHIGPIQVHTYGIGLALTFWFALWYMRRRFRAVGYPWEWLNRAFLPVIVAAVVGARAVHVIANLTGPDGYAHHADQILAVWHGGLSSFGGLLFGIPVAIWFQRRYAPELTTWAALDVAAPVLMAAWAMGRLLGPQLMIDGGGHATNAWYGMRYACTFPSAPGKALCDQVVNGTGVSGTEVPVPLFQAAECLVIFLILRWIEERTRRQPPGVMLAAFAGLWGIVRFTDEYFWLATPRLWDAVEVTGLVLAAAGWTTMAVMRLRHRGSADPAGSGEGGQPPEGGLVGLGVGGERVDDVGQHVEVHAGAHGQDGLSDPLVGPGPDGGGAE